MTEQETTLFIVVFIVMAIMWYAIKINDTENSIEHKVINLNLHDLFEMVRELERQIKEIKGDNSSSDKLNSLGQESDKQA